MNTTEALLGSLQADAPVLQVRVGAFWTAVVVNINSPSCGLASTLRPAMHHGDHPVPDAGLLAGRSGYDLAGLLPSLNVMEASIGMAAFNALLHIDEALCTEANAREVILERGTGRKVAIVGHFPFVRQVRQVAAECWVLELNPRPGDLSADRATEVLPRADVVALTGTSLINHTFDHLIGLCRPGALVILLGGSAPLTPVLFDRGVDVLSGTRVVDVPAALQAVGQGATFRQIPGKRLLTMVQDNEAVPPGEQESWMPIDEYRCRECAKIFEVLVRAGTTVACPSCGSLSVDKRISAPFVVSGQTSRQAGHTCCGREERCAAPSCSKGSTCWRGR